MSASGLEIFLQLKSYGLSNESFMIYFKQQPANQPVEFLMFFCITKSIVFVLLFCIFQVIIL